ncbi:MAG TPA: EamA family transporter [Steroidobacteraceae bacterium]|nr:EamA family transporter [Steroidobacteraceae bacterium]
MKPLFTAVISIALSVAAQFSLKAGMSSPAVRATLGRPPALSALFSVLTNRYVLGGFLLYGLGAVVWLAVLSKWEVSKAYPLVGLGFVFTVAIGYLLGEQVHLLRLAGVVLICSGVWLVASS